MGRREVVVYRGRETAAGGTSLRSFSAKRQRTLRLSQDWMNTVVRVSWLPFNSVPSTKNSYSFLYDFYFVFVCCWKRNNSREFYYWMVDMSWMREILWICNRWIAIFVLLKRNNSREFCCWLVGTIGISISLLPFFY